MAATRKFLFETNFDKPEARVPGPAGDSRPVVKPPIPMTEEEIAALKAEAFAQGRAEGAEEARMAAETVAAQALARIELRLKEAMAALDAAEDAIKRDAVQAAMFTVRKLAPGFAKNGNLAEVESLVSSCLGAMLDEPRVVVRIHDSLLDPLKARIADVAERAGFGGRVVLIADDNMNAADCRVEWADGGAERDSEWMWSQIEGVVQRFLSGLSVPMPPGAPAPGASTNPITE
jgi:flagellar assembly protein FliH